MQINSQNLQPGDIVTEVTRYNLMRNQRLVYLDLHRTLSGKLAGEYVCVPNLINIVAEPRYQGLGATAEAALNDCLAKIKGLDIMDIFPAASGGGQSPRS